MQSGWSSMAGVWVPWSPWSCHSSLDCLPLDSLSPFFLKLLAVSAGTPTATFIWWQTGFHLAAQFRLWNLYDLCSEENPKTPCFITHRIYSNDSIKTVRFRGKQPAHKFPLALEYNDIAMHTVSGQLDLSRLGSRFSSLNSITETIASRKCMGSGCPKTWMPIPWLFSYRSPRD